MEKCLNKTQKNMKSLVLALLFMGVVIGVANAAPTQPPLPTSYWGFVRIAENGSLMPNTSITVLAAGTGIASAISNSDGSYLVIVPWDDTATTQDEGVVSGETITFTVSGKTVTSRVIDLQGTNNKLDLNVPTTTTTTTTTTTSGGPSGGPGGGGGGGVVSGEQFSNIEKTETRDNSLFAGKPVTYIYTTLEGGIYEIAATGKENENDISIRVEKLKGVSSLVKEPAPGTVYHYVNIWSGTKKIQEALIKFKVENSWIASIGAASSEVKMLKWDGSKWIVLPTSEKSKDGTNTYYEAITETFSPFAVSVVKEGAIITETPGVTAATPAPAGTPAVTVTPIVSPPTRWAYIIVVIAIIVIATVAYLYTTSRKKEKK